jgi:Trk-type K+ transport system membrane component
MVFIKKINQFIHSTPIRLISAYYLSIVLVFGLIFWLPITHNPGVEISFLDALFTATSGLSVTGLLTLDFSESFNTFGLIMMLIAVQAGAMGLTTVTAGVWFITGHKISTRERSLIMADQNHSALSGLVKMLKLVLISFVSVQLLFAGILSLHLYLSGYSRPLATGFLLSTMSVTNGGFEIHTLNMADFHGDFFVQAMVMLLIFFGTMGFPVIMDIQKFWEAKRLKKRFRFSLYTRLTMIASLLLWLGGILGFWIFERHYFLADKGPVSSLFYAAFQSITTRSAGLTTADITRFTHGSLVMFAVLMFVGASPNSTGGGIRTTTLAIIFLAILSYSTGKEHVNAFNREIPPKTVNKAVMIYLFATMLVVFVTLFLSATENFNFLEIIFEVCSAFGTAGLSLGITENLTDVGKVTLIILMFIGRIGIATFLLLFRQRMTPAKVRYPQADIIIG